LTTIKEIASTNAFWGFRDLFLVATHHQNAGVHGCQPSIESGWKLTSDVWDSAINMKYVPLDSIRAHAGMTLSASTGSGFSSPIQSPTLRTNFQSMAPLELSRKRRNDNEATSPKRSRFEEGDRPVLLAVGRAHTTSSIPATPTTPGTNGTSNQGNETSSSHDFDMDFAMEY